MALNESPSEKEGKSLDCRHERGKDLTLNESPSEKEGKLRRSGAAGIGSPLNESPSEKEGKF